MTRFDNLHVSRSVFSQEIDCKDAIYAFLNPNPTLPASCAYNSSTAGTLHHIVIYQLDRAGFWGVCQLATSFNFYHWWRVSLDPYMWEPTNWKSCILPVINFSLAITTVLYSATLYF
ncbi:hypothetical protein BDN70DRAFT_874882 [Pholiota conissans]|uniref:Uncharacterized protein n=1 Tax=Pholiota conissans TaxID=109636 RepID=A0A9P5ZAQ3_9AGAR|nr:hypothetical protein BDN70DRAFT_874882 [Pholiota conissans]